MDYYNAWNKRIAVCCKSVTIDNVSESYAVHLIFNLGIKEKEKK